MVDILLYDGTRDLKSGKILGSALEEIARFYKKDFNFITSEPGTWDVPRWRIVDNIVKENFDPNRDPNGQVRYEDIQDCIKKVPEVRNNPKSKKIVLVESDLYYGDLNWCFGGCDGFKEYIIVSTARFTDPIHELGLYIHELGHMFGAAPRGRTNTEEKLGSHCINDYCVMQQKMSIKEFSEHDNEIADLIEDSSLDSWFCNQCQDDIERKSRR